MKKYLVIFCAAFLISNSSQATGLFVGADALFAKSNHRAKNYSSISGPKNGSIQDADNLNFGVNAGYRIDLLNLLVSGELFYDDLRTSSRDFESTANQINNGNSIAIKNRYGAKVNAGFAILPRITPFVTYGLTNVNYSSDVLSANNSLTKSEFTPLYGLGILFDLPLGISLKASYDYQQFDMRYAQSGSKIRTHLGVAKVGVVYNF